MLCDMCGSEKKLYKVNVEGAELNLCNGCSKFGKVISDVKQENEENILKGLRGQKTEITQIITQDYSDKIRKKREELKLTQSEPVIL